MRLAILTLVLLTSCTVLGSERVVVQGYVSFDSGGKSSITSCNDGQTYRIGVMASSPYFYYSSTYQKLSKNGQVLVQISGISIKGKAKVVLNSPEVISINNGKCNNT